VITKQTFDVGSLLFRVRTGNPAIILEIKETHRGAYGSGDEWRLRYRLFEEGRTFWKMDTEVKAEYRADPNKPYT
jgi:hypothetical protein